MPQHQPPSDLLRKDFQSQILKGGVSEKNECLVELKTFLPQTSTWGAYYVPCQERLCIIKYGFEG